MGDEADYFLDMELYRRWPETVTEPPRCRRCGEWPLYWRSTAAGWRLYGPSGKPHYCRPDPKTMFDDENA